MMKKRSKLLLPTLLLALVLACVGGGSLAALAAVKESELTDILIRSSIGQLNTVDWEITGENTDAYKINNKGSVLQNKQKGTFMDGLSGRNWILSGTPVGADKAVTMEIDVINVPCADTWFTPYFWQPDFNGYPQGGAPWSTLDTIYAQRPLQTYYPQLTAGTRYRLVYGTDGSETSYTAPIKEDGTYGEFIKIGERETKLTIPSGDKFYFGFKSHYDNFFGDQKGELQVDNFVLKSGDDEVLSCDFTDTTALQMINGKDDTLTPVAGKLSVSNAGLTTICDLKIVNPKADNRIITTDIELKADPDVDTVAAFAADIRLDTVAEGDKVGVSFGLQNDTQKPDAQGTSFVYLENAAGVTQVNVLNDGTAGTPISLGANVAGQYVHLELTIAQGGKTAVAVNGTALEGELLVKNIAGRVAFDHIAAGNIAYSLDKDVSIKLYEYQEGEGEDCAINFNGGYINEEYFVYDSIKASMFADESKAEGLKTEDDALFFKGTGDMTYFGFTKTYANFILEFDYINYLSKDRPVTSYASYSPLGIHFAAEQYGLSGSPAYGEAIYFFDGPPYPWVLLRYEHHRSGGPNDDVYLQDADPDTGTPGATRPGMVPVYGQTSKIKIVVANNNVKVYAVNLTEGKALSEYKTSDYTLLADWACKDTFGLVDFCTTESGYFKLDNIRITNIDDKSPAKVLENVAAYKDFQPIADERVLDTPDVTLEGAVASWTAVTGASGYDLTVGGQTTRVGADVLTYTFAQTEPGDYKLEVVAVYDGTENVHNSKAGSVTYKIAAPEPPSDKDKDKDKKDEKGCGCGSSAATPIGAAAVLLVGAAATLMAVRRKKA